MATVSYKVTADKLALIVTTTQENGFETNTSYLPGNIANQIDSIKKAIATQTAQANTRIAELQVLSDQYNALAAQIV